VSTTPGSTPPLPPPPPADSPRRGCLIAIVVAVVLLLVVTGGCIWLVKSKGKQLMSAMMAKAKPTFEQAMAPEVPPETRTAFSTEYDAYMAYVMNIPKDEHPDPQALQVPFQSLQAAIADKRLTTDEVQTFIDAARKARKADATP
jgi:hypothetical protein